MLEINVTQEHINQGLKGDSCRCPVALAIKEQFSNARAIVTQIFIEADGKAYNPNTKVIEFMERFDIGKSVEPFSTKLHELIDF